MHQLFHSETRDELGNVSTQLPLDQSREKQMWISNSFQTDVCNELSCPSRVKDSSFSGFTNHHCKAWKVTRHPNKNLSKTHLSHISGSSACLKRASKLRGLEGSFLRRCGRSASKILSGAPQARTRRSNNPVRASSNRGDVLCSYFQLPHLQLLALLHSQVISYNI